MTVSSSTNKVSYNGNGVLTTFAYTFKIFDEDDLTVILRASDGTETVQTITTHYTVTGVGDVGGGNVEFVTAPTATQDVVILREQPLTQGLDIVPNDPFPAQNFENALDKLTFMVQQQAEELGRSIKASRTTTLTSSEFTSNAADRANKIFAFDGNGDLDFTQEIGTFQGNWAASTTYAVRDIVKDSSNNNIYIANTAHTSSGSLPLSGNADIAKWDILVDAASAASSAAAAAGSAAAASSSATSASASASAAAASSSSASGSAAQANVSAINAASSASDASTSETNAAASEGAANTSKLAAASSASAASSSASAASASETAAAASEAAAAASEAAAAASEAAASTSEGNALTYKNAAETAQTAAETAQTAAEAAQAAAELAADNFDDTYLGSKSSDPTVDNDGGALNAGDLYFNTTSNTLKVYSGSAWQDAAIDSSGFVQTTGDTLTGNLSFGDNDKAIFGAGSDLQIYHDGSNSYIKDAGTGNLVIGADTFTYIGNPEGTATAARFNSGGAQVFNHNNNQKLATTSTGIDVTGTVTADGLTVDQGGTATLNLTSGASSWGMVAFGDPDDADVGRFFYDHGSNALTTRTAATNRMQIAGNGDISFYEDTGTTAKFFWDASAESLGLGTTSPANTIHMFNSTNSGVRFQNTSTGSGASDGSYVGNVFNSSDFLIQNGETAALLFNTANTERMRIDSSGNLLVGQTSTADYVNIVGSSFRSTGFSTHTRDGGEVLVLNRLTSDGDIVHFRKDNTIVGSIGTFSAGGGDNLTIGGGDTRLMFLPSSDAIIPRGTSDAARDDAIDLGSSSNRFDDIYATNGTIQTSDRNEKQDIAELDEAEKRVATAAKGLIRKYRWIDAVQEKGDDARIHVGIIAQDLQAAFAAEGLDAGDYAMFIHTTWTDEETGEERSRMGVRYSELLAFIIAAI